MLLYRFSLSLALVTAGWSTGAISQEIKQKFIPKGVTAKTGGYSPIRAVMDEKAELFKKEPEGLMAQKYGKITIEGESWGFLLNEPEEGEATLFIDSNRDGDLTNDTAVEWKGVKNEATGLTQYTGKAEIKLPDGNLGAIGLYRFDPKDEKRAQLKDTVMFYLDFGYEFMFKLDDKEFSTFVAGVPKPNGSLALDRDGNGIISSRLERAKIGEPFNFTGTTYEIRVLDGKLLVGKSEKELPQSPMPPDLRIGKTAIEFAATKMDGEKVTFPGSFAGKVVMLDFWATWCGPCIAEIPNMKVAYEEWHDKGFEILGISLDREGEEEKVKKFLETRELPWPQVYEGKAWDVEIARTYDVSGIPFVLLVDGDSGKIIGTSRQLRGEGLSEFIGKQLEKKESSAKTSANE